MADHIHVPDETATLSSGAQIPLLGFGTWRLSDREAKDAVAYALEVGYRHIDTATMYQNESGVGSALASSGIAREDVFVTTKLPPEAAGRERQTIEQSLSALGVDALDLWLVHWPPGGAAPEVWEQFVAARAEGLTRAIGVSNYSLGQIDELTTATGVTPEVNQVKWAPARHDPEVFAGHRERGVVLEGYSPFRAGRLDDPVIVEVATRHGVEPAQVVVRWHVQRGIVVIPKSARPERIASNADVGELTLSDEEMAALDGLGGR
jgi:diketogulonate reductase-like aldo/keto reductase